DEKTMAACVDVLKEDEVVVVSGRLQPDRFSGGLRMKVQQMWALSDARCRYARYLQVSVGENMPDVPGLLRQFPAKVEETESGNVTHGVKVRLDLVCKDDRGSASCELELGESSRFYPSDAALAAWYGSVGAGQVKVIYK
ncbi:MAG: DNA polymerase III subunit alpha, partial [Comamonas sp.]